VGLPPGEVLPIQLGLLALGTIGSMALAWLIAQRESPTRVVGAAAPWMALTLVLLVVAVWMLAQPMEMRAVGALG
jgi:uncharacterized membrane protein YecN with MAPEG domain